MDADEIVDALKKEYPLGVRVLPDGSVAALVDLLTTRSIMLGCDEWNWKRRFCFANRRLADEWFQKIERWDQVPTGYVARRPSYEDQADPYLNKLHNRPWNKEFERG